MNGKIIISSTGRKNNKWIAFFLSLLFTGLGQIYSGSAIQGIIFLLLKILATLALPFYSLWKSGASLATGIFTAIIVFIILNIAAALHAFIISIKNNVRSSWYNSRPFYLLYGFSSLLLTLFSVIIFFSFFDIVRLNNDAAPLFRKGDIIAAKKINRAPFNRGELILLKDQGGERISRIITIPGEKVSIAEGRFFVDDYELPLTIFTEKELQKLSVSDYDVISEQNGVLRYPVIKGNKDFTLQAALTEKEYFVSPDDRRDNAAMIKVSADQVKAIIEGIIYSPSSGILPGKTYLPVE